MISRNLTDWIVGAYLSRTVQLRELEERQVGRWHTTKCVYARNTGGIKRQTFEYTNPCHRVL